MMEQYGRDYTKESSTARQREYIPQDTKTGRVQEPDRTTVTGYLRDLTEMQRETMSCLARLSQFSVALKGTTMEQMANVMESTLKELESNTHNNAVITVMDRLRTACDAQKTIRDYLNSTMDSLETIL